MCDVTSGDPPPGAARPSPLLEQSPASRSVSGPRRSLRMRVDRLGSFSKLITGENHCVNGRKTTTWAGSVPLTRVILSADLPRTEKRRRVSVQHKGVSQGLRIISRRSKSPFSPDFWCLWCLVATPVCAFSHPEMAFVNCGVYWTRARGDPGTVNNGSTELLTEGGGVSYQPRIITHQPSAFAKIHPKNKWWILILQKWLQQFWIHPCPDFHHRLTVI